MQSKDSIIITMTLQDEIRRLKAMLAFARKAKTKDDYDHLSKGFEIAAQDMVDAVKICKDVKLGAS